MKRLIKALSEISGIHEDMKIAYIHEEQWCLAKEDLLAILEVIESALEIAGMEY